MATALGSEPTQTVSTGIGIGTGTGASATSLFSKLSALAASPLPSTALAAHHQQQTQGAIPSLSQLFLFKSADGIPITPSVTRTALQSVPVITPHHDSQTQRLAILARLDADDHQEEYQSHPASGSGVANTTEEQVYRLLLPATREASFLAEYVRLDPKNVELESRLLLYLPGHTEYAYTNITEYFFNQIKSMLQSRAEEFKGPAMASLSTAADYKESKAPDVAAVVHGTKKRKAATSVAGAASAAGAADRRFVPEKTTDYFYDDEVRGTMSKEVDPVTGKTRTKMVWIRKHSLAYMDFHVSQRPLGFRISASWEVHCDAPEKDRLLQSVRKKERWIFRPDDIESFAIMLTKVQCGATEAEAESKEPTWEVECEFNNLGLSMDATAEEIIGDIMWATMTLLGIELPFSIVSARRVGPQRARGLKQMTGTSTSTSVMTR